MQKKHRLRRTRARGTITKNQFQSGIGETSTVENARTFLKSFDILVLHTGTLYLTSASLRIRVPLNRLSEEQFPPARKRSTL